METIELELQKLPSIPTLQECRQDPKTYSLRLERWAFDMGREMKFSEKSQENMYDIFAWACQTHAITDEQRMRMFASLDAGYKNGCVPPDIIGHVYDATKWYKANIGTIPAPSWCRAAGPMAYDLWLAVKILGAGGRSFKFAREKIGQVFGFKSGSSVQQFVKVMLDHGYIKRIIKGCQYGDPSCRGGKSDEFEIIDPVERQNLVSMLGSGFGSMAKKRWKKYLVDNFAYLNMESALSVKKKQPLFG